VLTKKELVYGLLDERTALFEFVAKYGTVATLLIIAITSDGKV
jgi:hypothetical protein